MALLLRLARRTPRRCSSGASRLDGSGEPERLTPATRARQPRVRHRAQRALCDPHLVVVGNAAADRSRAAARRTRSCARSSRTRSSTSTLAGLRQGPMEFFQVDIGDGVKLDAWMMKPPDFDPSKKYPVLFYVYGEPCGPDRARRVRRFTLALAPDAHAAGLHRGERRQPRHAGSRAAATGASRCTTRSARCACTTSRSP